MISNLFTIMLSHIYFLVCISNVLFQWISLIVNEIITQKNTKKHGLFNVFGISIDELWAYLMPFIPEMLRGQNIRCLRFYCVTCLIRNNEPWVYIYIIFLNKVQVVADIFRRMSWKLRRDNYLTLQSFEFESTWRRLFQKRTLIARLYVRGVILPPCWRHFHNLQSFCQWWKDWSFKKGM
jgi:hypothetical protein